MKSLKIGIIFVCVTISVVGCSKISKLDRSDEYKKVSPHNKHLILPKDLSDSSIENRYPIPKIEDDKQAIDISTVPPGTSLSK